MKIAILVQGGTIQSVRADTEAIERQLKVGDRLSFEFKLSDDMRPAKAMVSAITSAPRSSANPAPGRFGMISAG
jgi:hypothetical protein